MKLDELSISRSVKVMCLGDSKSGKTGSLASLAKAGFNLRILDFDNGARILLDILKDDPEARKRIDIEICSDPYQTKAGRVSPKSALGWTKALTLLDNWPPYGHVETWTTQDVLVVDSLSFAGQMAMNFSMNLNGRLMVPPTWQDYKAPQQYIADFLSLLYTDAIKCNVVTITHLDYTAPPGTTRDDKAKQEIFRGYPSSVGSALGPKIGRYYNSMLLYRTDGASRNIWTSSRDNVELGTEIPSSVKTSYPIASGLASFFAAVRGETPPAGPATELAFP